MKKLGKTVLCIILLTCILGPIDRDTIKNAYAKIYHFFAPESVNPVIDAGADLTEGIAGTVRESDILGRIKKSLNESITEFRSKE